MYVIALQDLLLILIQAKLVLSAELVVLIQLIIAVVNAPRVVQLAQLLLQYALVV